MPPDAYIVHQISNRVRLRLDEMRNDDDFFDLAIEKLSSLGCLSKFHTNRTAGSIVLIYYDSEWPEVVEELENIELFNIVDTPRKKVNHAMSPMVSNVKQLNRMINEGSNGRVDLRSFAYLLLMALTVRQIMQGKILGPALPMLMHAWSIADKFNFDETDLDSE